MPEITGSEGVQWNVTALRGCATRHAVRIARLHMAVFVEGGKLFCEKGTRAAFSELDMWVAELGNVHEQIFTGCGVR